jgi:alpha-amylase
MIGLIAWTRSFTYDAAGNIIRGANGLPVFAAHPQPNLWLLLVTNARRFAENFDLIQFPPASNGAGEGYAPFQLRNYNSNWGTQAELIDAVAESHACGLRVSPDLPFRQMNGENGGPGVFTYPAGEPGSTTPSWFQYFKQPGETLPPFVEQDDVPDPAGDFAFGRVRSYQHSNPAGIVESDTTDVLDSFIPLLGLVPGKDIPRWDDGKGMHAASCLRIMRSQPGLDFLVEFFSGNPAELDWYVRTVMQNRCAVEDYAQYWHTQNACNQYDARLFDAGGGGYWRWNSGASIGFVNNPDVATSWTLTGGISQQIAFNLLLGYAYAICLPYKLFLVYGEDYFPASPDYPTGRGLKPFLDNLAWISRTFAFGGFEKRWEDKDVYAYTRDGDGGPIGWSGGLLVALNFNTYTARTITVQTTWPEGTYIHNYSATGNNEYAHVGPGGRFTFTIKSNYFSGGQSYMMWAVAGVNQPVPIIPITLESAA